MLCYGVCVLHTLFLFSTHIELLASLPSHSSLKGCGMNAMNEDDLTHVTASTQLRIRVHTERESASVSVRYFYCHNHC